MVCIFMIILYMAKITMLKMSKGASAIMYKRLRELRRTHRQTQTNIAEVIGTTYQYYSTYEKGIRDIPLDRAKKLALYYNVSLDYLAGLSEDPEKSWLDTPTAEP